MLVQLTRALTDADTAAASATMADDVTLRVAVHDQPFTGVEMVRSILGVVLDGPLHDVLPVEHFDAAHSGGGESVQVQTFTAGVAGYSGGRADGLLVARAAADGRIADLTVFLRPLAALAALADEMGRRMGGPRPDGDQ